MLWTRSNLLLMYMYVCLMAAACMHVCATAGDDRQVWRRSEGSCGWRNGRLAGRLQCASCGHSDGSNEQVSCRLLAIAIVFRFCSKGAASLPEEVSLSFARKAGVGLLQRWHC